ncbi:23S rRNA (adenine(1618)-N(6))-methyltransferase RlmF [Joostella atrarenae]|uniref:Ribosomal RNA large subunit methyltransferase F n=1 Tax=Joostella atrarenae TaxID=679257 RepID=A0ABS9J6B7_9FLAO|nr:23S rRNA (adenine(1618)-N(6))-methyltransferase RlmF [Joostella atrarenae]MCF8715976.1 23S rRNA (adenine(1618)-N(6))-methyltransferase RlmF [Joostella atrarenae]
MAPNKKPSIKSKLHPRNKNRENYDLAALVACTPALAEHIKLNKSDEPSINFANPAAVKLLNKGLLHHYYGIEHWDFPDNNLCPPIPGRADYLHYIADLLAENNAGKLPKGSKITCLDVGIGANTIYPILGVAIYDWNFIGSDIDAAAIASAEKIIAANPSLKDKIECRLQKDKHAIFKGIIGAKEAVDITICNPPFHASKEDAIKGTMRKVKNLSGKKDKHPTLNFSGVSNELIYEGGESQFINNMISDSKKMDKNCFWFTTLVSKESNLKGIYKHLKKVKATTIKTIPMGTGNKSTRIVAWTFLNKQEQQNWIKNRWK